LVLIFASLLLISLDLIPSLPLHILANLDELHRKLGKIVQKQDKIGHIDPTVLSLHRALVIYSSWRNTGQATRLNKDDTLPVRAIKLSLHRLASGKVPAATVLADLALPALDILAVETEINTQEENALIWTAYWLAACDAGLQAGKSYLQQMHDTVLRLTLSTIHYQVCVLPWRPSIQYFSGVWLEPHLVYLDLSSQP